MKILYAIQGTGNGHIARATEIVPILKSMAETDVLVSGTQADLQVPFSIDYRFPGLSFIFGKRGGVDILKTICRLQFVQFLKDIRALPVQKYDLVISDFEPVSAWACRLHGKKCIGLSHQFAVLKPSFPKPTKSRWLGEIILRHYAPTAQGYGFHFKPSFPDIFPPVVRSAIRHANSTVKPHFTVYLPSYSNRQIYQVLSLIPTVEWQVFSKHTNQKYNLGNIHFEPVSLDGFTESLINCTGLICTAGFESPAEALYLGKKLCVVPMKNQYEQQCNAALLGSMGIRVIQRFTGAASEIADWVFNQNAVQIVYPDLTKDILDFVVLGKE
jgi:uncharacterized protein (TIGR00661 family)